MVFVIFCFCFIGVCKLLSKYLNNIDIKSSVGLVCQSKSFGDFKIIEYKGYNNVVIEFLETGYQKLCQNKEIKTGAVKDKLLPTVLGVGIVGDKYDCKINGNHVKEYQLWVDMLKRCYSEKRHLSSPTYKECEVSENFKSYEYFYEWCNKQVGFGVQGFDLDKDLLAKGNKVYSEHTCVFVPHEINSLLVTSKSRRGNHPIGVMWHKASNKFCAILNVNKQRYLGFFNSELEAFEAYKQAKESFIKEQANKWKGKIDDRAYEALMSYEVSIDD